MNADERGRRKTKDESPTSQAQSPKSQVSSPKSQVQSQESDSGSREPSAELVGRFEDLERKIQAAIELIGRLKEENRALAGRLAEVEQVRRQAAERIDAVLDKIAPLT